MKECSTSNVEEMQKLKDAGWSLQKIGEKYGITKQSVCQKLASPKPRKKDYDIERIIFNGIYNLFAEDPYMSVSKLARIMWGTAEGERANAVKLQNFITGENDSSFKLSHINRLIEYSGMTYDELFSLRHSAKT